MKRTRFYIVRHGQSEGNIDLTKTEADPPLTKIGVQQAKRRAKDLQEVAFHVAYSSLLTRAVQTTSILLEGKTIPHNTDNELREREYGSFFLRPEFERVVDEIVLASQQLSTDEWWEYTHPEAHDIETYKSCFSRFFSSLKEISNAHQNQNILLVSHGDLMRALLVFSNFGTHKEINWEAVQNTGYIIVDIENNLPKIIHTVDILVQRT